MLGMGKLVWGRYTMKITVPARDLAKELTGIILPASVARSVPLSIGTVMFRERDGGYVDGLQLLLGRDSFFVHANGKSVTVPEYARAGSERAGAPVAADVCAFLERQGFAQTGTDSCRVTYEKR